MFAIMLKKIIPLFPNLQDFSWNYLESGRGKGAADGVGGVIKRTCDRLVAANVKEVSTVKEFSECIREHIQNIRILDSADRDHKLEEDIKAAIHMPGKCSSKILTIIKPRSHDAGTRSAG